MKVRTTKVVTVGLSLYSIITPFNGFEIACIDVPRPLINDLWVFLFETIDAECLK